ncbi:putative non-reducing polyketide synthase, partial [Exidia glandulosa HHB12029]
PQHRVLLETVVDALDDAGYRPRDEGGKWDRERMGVFIGSSVDSYQNNLATDIDAFFCPGMIRGFAAGRVSYHFQWQGPSIVYDTACSSGLVAVHAACQSLLLRECDGAVAGGTNMITSPEMSIALSKGFFISQTGGCRTFDESGDGYCRAEAVGALILKRLDDALRDNDNIHAVILASGVNQSGPAESLTKPHAPSQAALFAANCARAGISPLAVRAVEAHGTGTQAGDYAEIEAIKTAFTSGRPPVTGGEEGPAKDTQLFVSALKPNVGHSESTSGIASIIKATLMMQHKEVAPHIGITTRRNLRLGDIEAHGIVIPTRSQPLTPVAGYDKIIISVNNFGAPGGNANVLLQENRLKRSSPGADPRSYHVVTLSGKAHTPFGILVDRLLEHLEQNPSIDLASLSYTTTARRIDHPARAAFSVSSIEELKEQLKRSPAPTTRKSKATPKVGFVIGGNGSQFQGMGRTLYETSPSFKKHVDDCDAALAAAGGSGLLRVIRGELDPLAHDFESMLGASAAIFAIGYALGQLWREWGVEPSVIMG